MKYSGILGGLAGATAITLIHESIKHVVPKAPRMDLLSMSALEKGLKSAGADGLSRKALYSTALAGDLVSNSLYYAMAGLGKTKNVWVRSSILGVAAGLSAVFLPGPMGLNEKHSSRTTATAFMTIGLYVTGALVTAAVIKALEGKKAKREVEWERRLVTSSMG